MNHFLVKEFFFDIDDMSILKKLSWAVASIIVLLFAGIYTFAAIVLIIAGIYSKKEGIKGVKEYLVYTFTPLIAIIAFIAINVLIATIGG